MSHLALRADAEFDIVRRMLARWGEAAHDIGDDASVIPDGIVGALVVSTDVSVENVHFRREWLSPQEIGYRATAAALSDLAAMAARPVGILVALTLPESWRDDVDALADGIGDAANLSEVRVLGGDLSAGRDLALAITVLGSTVAPLRRNTARAGDLVYVTGTLGGPLAAVAALTAGKDPAPEDRARFAHPVPRIREAMWLAERGVTTATDISDGLVSDLSNIAAASGVCITIELNRVPAVAGVSPSEVAAGGEEYELALSSAVPLDTRAFTAEFDLPLTEIGSVAAGAPEVRVLLDGRPVVPLPGYFHFR